MPKSKINEALSSLPSMGKRSVQAMVQANVITSAKNDLTRDQRRIVHHLLREIYVSHRWPEGGTVTIDFKDYASIYRISHQEARDDLRKAINDFRGKAIVFSQKLDSEHDWGPGELSEVEIDWTTKREKLVSAGRYRVTFNPELRDLLMPLMARDEGKNILFTYLDRNETRELQLKYSVRLYEALCQFQASGIFMVSLQELLDRWAVPKTYREKYSDFKRSILLKSLNEIRAKTRFVDVTLSERTGDRGKVNMLIFQFTPSRLE